MECMEEGAAGRERWSLKYSVDQGRLLAGGRQLLSWVLRIGVECGKLEGGTKFEMKGHQCSKAQKVKKKKKNSRVDQSLFWSCVVSATSAPPLGQSCFKGNWLFLVSPLLWRVVCGAI